MSEHLDPQQMIEYMRRHAGAFMRILDGHIEAIDQQRGWARLRWQPTEACCHSGAIVQGGFVTSMLDAAMAHAVTARIGTGMMARNASRDSPARVRRRRRLRPGAPYVA